MRSQSCRSYPFDASPQPMQGTSSTQPTKLRLRCSSVSWSLMCDDGHGRRPSASLDSRSSRFTRPASLCPMTFAPRVARAFGRAFELLDPPNEIEQFKAPCRLFQERLGRRMPHRFAVGHEQGPQRVRGVGRRACDPTDGALKEGGARVGDLPSEGRIFCCWWDGALADAGPAAAALIVRPAASAATRARSAPRRSPPATACLRTVVVLHPPALSLVGWRALVRPPRSPR